NLGLRRPVEPEFPDVTLRLTIGFFEDLLAGFLASLAALGTELAGDMSAFGPYRLLAQLVLKSKLNGMIAVAFRRAHLQNRTGTDGQDRHRSHFALVVKHLRHADLQTQQSQWHRKTSRMNEPRV